MLCIHKASGDRICQNWQHLEGAKNGMFYGPKVSTLGNFWTCLKLPIAGPETYLALYSLAGSANSPVPQNILQPVPM